MKELLQSYAAYNVWANKIVTDLILSLPDEKQVTEMPSSFKSLKATVLHMWDVESIWWQRIKMAEHIKVPSSNEQLSILEISRGLIQQSAQWHTWLMETNPKIIDHVFAYQNTKKELFKQPVYQALLHLFNHASYTRGQLVNMLRQCGVKKIPPTDYIVWSRKK